MVMLPYYPRNPEYFGGSTEKYDVAPLEDLTINFINETL